MLWPASICIFYNYDGMCCVGTCQVQESVLYTHILTLMGKRGTWNEEELCGLHFLWHVSPRAKGRAGEHHEADTSIAPWGTYEEHHGGLCCPCPVMRRVRVDCVSWQIWWEEIRPLIWMPVEAIWRIRWAWLSSHVMSTLLYACDWW